MQEHEDYRSNNEDHLIRSFPCMMRKFLDNNIVFDRAVAYLLHILAERHADQFARAIDLVLPGWTNSHPGSEVLDLTFKPWAIPSQLEVTTMARTLQLRGPFDRFTSWGKAAPSYHDRKFTGPRDRYRRKVFFSASAVAIRFLNRIPTHQRLNMRKVVINEDRPAVGLAMCHAIGLIPFCQENTELHIEHRWNLWTTLLLGMSGRSTSELAIGFETSAETIQDWEDDPDRTRWPFDDIERDNFASTFSAWTMNILDIVKSGMPLRSYSVVIEGDPDLNHSTFAFHDVMACDIAWLTLNTDCVARGVLAPKDHHDYPFMTKTPYEVATPGDARSSLIQCNFTLDQPWDLDRIQEKYSVNRVPTSSYRPMRSGNLWEPDLYYLRVSTNILDLKKLQLLWVERKVVPEEGEAAEHGGQEDQDPQ